ncbi:MULTISPECIES: precorrin-3B synthase [unclassified Gluconobacter]|uniref:precorrin-3B synthase n=1 Tax=unclassified Gluconobacter TaxID=2644261 RepID=UPI00176C2F26|nr:MULTISPECIES: precorrin-3B synthase [unclassified Gluconobacter]GFE97171.1 precorrin-3B synthase [Gluconobacter sp. Gdi]
MTVPSLVRGWCPDMFAPMEARDGLLVRVRSPLGGFDGPQVLAIAELARRFGNGVVELTNRGNVQLRGFSSTSAKLALESALAEGLVDPDPAKERRRAILVSPLAGLDPKCDPGTLDVAQSLQTALLEEDVLSGLSGKFGWVVDGGGYVPEGTLSADIALQSRPDGWSVVCGAMATEALENDAAVSAAVMLSRVCAESSDLGRPSRDTAAAAFALSKARLEGIPCKRQGTRPVSLIGPLPGQVMGVGLPFGRCHAKDFEVLAELTGTSRLRVTPWRSVLLPQQDGTWPGFITSSVDPLLRVEACIGRSGCAKATADVVETASALASDVPPGCVLHVSGCIKGCAHPRAADMTLVADDGHYEVVRNGRTTDTPSWHDMDIPQIRTLLRHELKETQV